MQLGPFQIPLLRPTGSRGSPQAGQVLGREAPVPPCPLPGEQTLSVPAPKGPHGPQNTRYYL